VFLNYTSQVPDITDKFFSSQDKHSFIACEFVWSGWDNSGEPAPYYSSRSSYCFIIDLDRSNKDQFYRYQSRWKSDLSMVHILPHWNWPNQVGQTTPVYVFTSGDEVELFFNGCSLGKKKKAAIDNYKVKDGY
jgi:beta-galactosidase